LGALQSNATSGQLGYWLQRGALSLTNMVGCFAMTELGHGSNVPGLETTATFDEASDQFIIHTPNVTATKVRHCIYFSKKNKKTHTHIVVDWWCRP
jgi:acyl-CoA oxidase